MKVNGVQIQIQNMVNMDNWTLNGQFPLSFVLHRKMKVIQNWNNNKGA